MADLELQDEFVKFVERVNNDPYSIYSKYLKYRELIISYRERFEANFRSQLENASPEEREGILLERDNIMKRFFLVWTPLENYRVQQEEEDS
jgi:hypothetical protein